MIRNLNETDFDEYYRVRLQALEQFPIAYTSMAKFFKECPKEKHMDLLKDSGSDSTFFYKGFFEKEKLIGVIGSLPGERESVNHKTTMWGLYVDPEYQSKGIGRKLLDDFLNDIKANKNLKSVRLMVALKCDKALSLFKSAGFEKYGQERDSISHDGLYYDQVYMQMSCS